MMGCCIKIRKFFLSLSLSVLTTELSHSHKNLSLFYQIKLSRFDWKQEEHSEEEEDEEEHDDGTLGSFFFVFVILKARARVFTHFFIGKEEKPYFFSRVSFCLKMDQFSLVT